MIGILVTGHGRFAAGLGSSLKFITGITENVVLVDYEEDCSIDTLKENLSRAMDELKHCEGILVLSDLAGGVPFRSAVECKIERTDQNIEVIAGTNLPMLIESGMMMAAYDCPLEMSEVLVRTGKDYIVRFELDGYQDDLEEDVGISTL